MVYLNPNILTTLRKIKTDFSRQRVIFLEGSLYVPVTMTIITKPLTVLSEAPREPALHKIENRMQYTAFQCTAGQHG